MATAQSTRIEHTLTQSVSDRWVRLGLLVGLSLLILLTYVRGLQNKPVAEELIRPQAFLSLGDDKQFRPTFALPMLAIETLVGPQTDYPVAYRLFSLSMHIVATLALFYCARRLTGSQLSAAAVALLFALYPRQHEPVFSIGAAAHLIMTAYCSVCCAI